MSSVRQRSPEPEDDGVPQPKRRRKIWSCLECRRKKLLCDRNLPICSRCARAGKSDSCIYIDDPKEKPSNDLNGTRDDAHQRTSDALRGTPSAGIKSRVSAFADQEKRIRHLEEALSLATSSVVATQKLPTSILTPDAPVGETARTSPPLEVKESRLLRGGSYRTRHNGATHSSSLIGLVPGLYQFVSEGFEKFPVMNTIRQDINNLENQLVVACSKKHASKDIDLRSLLPSRTEADRLVQAYMESYGHIYHILHLSDFWLYYGRLWQSGQTPDPRYLLVVLLVIAVALCLTTIESEDERMYKTEGRAMAVHIVESCEVWFRTTIDWEHAIEDFQIKFLILFAKQLSLRRNKQTWVNAGKTLREFVCAGLHRDPDYLKQKTSAVEKEMRRRLWAAITEFELQASFEHGMPATSWPQHSDTQAPVEDMDGDHEPVQSLHSAQKFTTTSYMTEASKSIRLRHELNSLLNDKYQSFTFEEVRILTERIEAALLAVPSWTDVKAQITRALLCLNLYQCLLALHERHVQRAATPIARRFSRMVLADTSLRVIRSHETVISSGSHALELLCGHHIRAALSFGYVCLTPEPQQELLLSFGLERTAGELFRHAIAMIGRKVVHSGGDHRQLWLTIAAHALVKLKAQPTHRIQLMQDALDEYTQLLSQAIKNRKQAALTVIGAEDGSFKSVMSAMPQGNGIAPHQVIDSATLGGAGLPSQDDLNPPTFNDWATDGWTIDGWAWDDWTSGDWLSDLGAMT